MNCFHKPKYKDYCRCCSLFYPKREMVCAKCKQTLSLSGGYLAVGKITDIVSLIISLLWLCLVPPVIGQQRILYIWISASIVIIIFCLLGIFRYVYFRYIIKYQKFIVVDIGENIVE